MHNSAMDAVIAPEKTGLSYLHAESAESGISRLHAEAHPVLGYNLAFQAEKQNYDKAASGHLPSLQLTDAQVKEARTIESDVMTGNVSGVQHELSSFHNNIKGFNKIATQIKYDLHGRGVEVLDGGMGGGDSHGHIAQDVSLSFFGARGGPEVTITSEPKDGILMGKIDHLNHGEDAINNTYVGGSGNPKHVLSDIAAGKHS